MNVSKEIIGTCKNGKHCIYDVPDQIKTIEQFNSLIYDYNCNPESREELWGQPKLLSLNGPMFNGFKIYNHEVMVIIRYEIPCKW